MRENFEKSIDLLFKLEGYESDDPNDLGGFTRYGISQRYHPTVNVPKLTKEGAIQIYLDEYWLKAGCDELDYPLDMVLFIQGVNLGVQRAKAFLEEGNGLLDFFMFNLNHYATREKSQRDKYLAGWNMRLVKLWRAL
jgi:lysozyme family protein